MTDENKETTPSSPVEVSPDKTQDPTLNVEEQTKPNGGGR